MLLVYQKLYAVKFEVGISVQFIYVLLIENKFSLWKWHPHTYSSQSPHYHANLKGYLSDGLWAKSSK